MRTLILPVVCLLYVSWPDQLQARTSPQIRAKAAKQACAAGDFRKGVDILAELYVDTSDTTYIFNQARCYEQNHQFVNAVDRFREYLLKTQDASAEAKADTERHIADCKRYQEEEQARTLPPAQPTITATTTTSDVPSTTRTAEVGATPMVSPSVPRTSTGSVMRTTGLVVGGLGLAVMATAIILNVKANNLANEANTTHALGTESSQKSYKTGALMCYSTGAAMLVTGGLLYLLDHHPSSEERSLAVSLLPAWMPGVATVTLSGEF
jgi:hypothetical protein